MSDGIIISGQVIGAEAVQMRLEQTSLAMVKRTRRTVHALGLTMLARVKEIYLSGESLNVKSGLLRRRTNEKFTEDGTSFTSSVGTNIPYGAAWEKGFDRRVGAGARGGPKKPMTDLAAMKYAAKHPPGTKHYDARPFLTPALDDMRAEIRERLVLALGGGA
jgi:phage gpG-like protein